MGRRLVRAVKKYYVAYLFISVPVLGMVVFLFIPMISSLALSFCDWSGIQSCPNMTLHSISQQATSSNY